MAATRSMREPWPSGDGGVTARWLILGFTPRHRGPSARPPATAGLHASAFWAASTDAQLVAAIEGRTFDRRAADAAEEWRRGNSPVEQDHIDSSGGGGKLQ